MLFKNQKRSKLDTVYFAILNAIEKSSKNLFYVKEKPFSK